MHYNIHRIFDKRSKFSTSISILLYLITEHINLNDDFKSFRILYSVSGRFSSLQYIFLLYILHAIYEIKLFNVLTF